MKRAQIARKLWDSLWEDYSRRVKYAGLYQQIIQQAGGSVANDRIAFRSLRLTVDSPYGKVMLGIPYLANIAEALGYEMVGEYEFPQKCVYARHYIHPKQDILDLPKLFISELVVDALPSFIAQQIEQSVACGNFYNLQAILITATEKEIVSQLKAVFTRPWEPPKRSIVQQVNAVSEYGAWVLLHGYAVNHFTGYVNRQNTPIYPDIESTARALSERGIPMKKAIEGSRESGLRQTSTVAVTEMVPVQDDNTGKSIEIPWSYAYYEIAERNLVEVSPGKTELFQGFLSSPARNLYEMTHTHV